MKMTQFEYIFAMEILLRMLLLCIHFMCSGCKDAFVIMETFKWSCFKHILNIKSNITVLSGKHRLQKQQYCVCMCVCVEHLWVN